MSRKSASRLRRQWVALFAASAREFVRDRLAMFFSFVFPLLFVGSLALSSARRDLPRPKLEVVDQSASTAAKRLIERLQRSADVRVLPADAPATPSRDADGLLVIPAAPTGPLVLIASGPAAPPLRQLLESSGSALALEAHGLAPAFSVVVRAGALRPSEFTVAFPGLLALALLELGLLATATPLVTARQRGTLQHLLLAPVNRLAAVIAHVAVRLVVALVQVALMSAVAVKLFSFHPASPLYLQVPLIALEAAMLVSLGYLAGALLPASDASYGILMIANIGFIFLGGVFSDPRAAGMFPLALVSPLFYAADANRQLLAGAPGVLSLAADAAAMGAWIVGGLLAAAAAVTINRKR